MKIYRILVLLLLQAFWSCNGQTRPVPKLVESKEKGGTVRDTTLIPFDTSFKTIHIFVSLCDNKYQGIVPVPSKIGNGQDANNNLYWGCGFGVRTYFKNSKEWTLVRKYKIDTIKLERIVFKHQTQKVYLVADAYNGKYIKKCTQDFLLSSCGQLKDTLIIDKKTIGIFGNANLISYVGHDGLMDFQLKEGFLNRDNRKRDVVILACYSKNYFSQYLREANVNPLVWTTGLMAPEAYTIHDAISGYVALETNESIAKRAALAYSRFQKCSVKAARNLLVTGW